MPVKKAGHGCGQTQTWMLPNLFLKKVEIEAGKFPMTINNWNIMERMATGSLIGYFILHITAV